MKRNVWNIVIDAISFVVFMLMISTGLLLKFILPPGSGRVEMLLRGSGRGIEKTIDVFMGLTRHEWGEIHFWIAFGFLIVLIVHLILHWNWIKAVTFGTKQCPQPFKRKVITISVMCFVIVALLLPWIAKKQTYTRAEFLQVRDVRHVIIK